MDIEAIMRVYTELQNVVLDLQREMELLPEGGHEWKVIGSIINAIDETSKTLMDVDEGKGSEQTEDQQKAPEHGGVSSLFISASQNKSIGKIHRQINREPEVEQLVKC